MLQLYGFPLSCFHVIAQLVQNILRAEISDVTTEILVEYL